MLQQSVAAPPPLPPVFAALADPSRLDMVDRLARGPASVTAIAGAYPMSMSAVLQHLKVLERSGVIRTEKTGRVRVCRIVPEALGAVEGWVLARRAALERRLDRLATHLEAENDA